MTPLNPRLIEAQKPVLIELDGVLLFRNEENKIFIDEKILKALQARKAQQCKLYALSCGKILNLSEVRETYPDLYDLFDDILELAETTEETYPAVFDRFGVRDKPCVYLFGRFLGVDFWNFATDQNIDAIGHPEEFGPDRWIDEMLQSAATIWPNTRETPNYISIEEHWLAANLLVFIARYACGVFAGVSMLDVFEDRHDDFVYCEKTQSAAKAGSYISHFNFNPASGAYGCLHNFNLASDVDDFLSELDVDADDIPDHVMKMEKVKDANFIHLVGIFLDCYDWGHDSEKVTPNPSNSQLACNLIADLERAQMVIKVDGKWQWTAKFVACIDRQSDYWLADYATTNKKAYTDISEFEPFLIGILQDLNK